MAIPTSLKDWETGRADAVTNMAQGGIFYSVSAGNKGEDACLDSPARAGAGIDNGIATVAGTNEAKGEMPISNYGSCVDIWAPGKEILSTKLGCDTTTMGGASMAGPHVGGGGVLSTSLRILMQALQLLRLR